MSDKIHEAGIEESALQMMRMPDRLRISKDAEWTHEGRVVSHQGLTKFFWTHLQKSTEHGCYVVAVSGKCVAVEVEDTAWSVKTIGLDDDPPRMTLCDESEEVFEPSSIEVGPENVFYCWSASKGEKVRILRNALQTIVPAIEERDGKFFFRVREVLYQISEQRP